MKNAYVKNRREFVFYRPTMFDTWRIVDSLCLNIMKPLKRIFMRQNQPKDVFGTRRWLYAEITDPYQVFAETFSHGDLAHFRNIIKKMLQYAEAEKIYKEEAPCDVLLNMKIILSVLMAAHALKDKKKGPIEVSEVDVFNKKYYCSNSRSLDPWSDFPRCLSKKEFCNPYLVFKKFFNYQALDKWMHDLEEIVDFALSRYRGELGLDMLAIYLHLTKLIEAAHLINVREVIHIGGILKNRFVTP